MIGLALYLALEGLVLMGCKPDPQPPMRIGLDVWPGYEPLFLATRMGSLPPEEFRFVEFSNSSAVGRGFRNNALEAACLTMDEVFYALQDGMDPVVLIVLDESCGADVLLAHKGINSLSELKGKRIGVEIAAVETYTLTRALQSVGLSVKDVIPVYLPIEKHLEAFQSGSVDAVVTYEPVRTKLLKAGAVDLFNSSKIPGEIVDVLVVRRDYLQNHPERGKLLQQSWFLALAQMRRSPHESAKIMALREKVSSEEFETSLKGLHLPDQEESRLLLGGDTPKLMDSAERLKGIMKDSGLLQKELTIRPLFTLPESMNSKPN